MPDNATDDASEVSAWWRGGDEPLAPEKLDVCDVECKRENLRQVAGRDSQDPRCDDVGRRLQRGRPVENEALCRSNCRQNKVECLGTPGQLYQGLSAIFLKRYTCLRQRRQLRHCRAGRQRPGRHVRRLPFDPSPRERGHDCGRRCKRGMGSICTLACDCQAHLCALWK